MTTTRRDLMGLAAFVGLCLGVGALSGLATVDGVRGWYLTLERPSWNPPSWIFGPMWTALYAAMGVAAWRVWRPGGFAPARGPFALFFAQLAVNAAWSPLFFALHRPDLAFADISALAVLIAATLVAFARRDRLAGGLFVPYLAWVLFAAALNFTIWRLNA